MGDPEANGRESDDTKVNIRAKSIEMTDVGRCPVERGSIDVNGAATGYAGDGGRVLVTM